MRKLGNRSGEVGEVGKGRWNVDNGQCEIRNERRASLLRNRLVQNRKGITSGLVIVHIWYTVRKFDSAVPLWAARRKLNRLVQSTRGESGGFVQCGTTERLDGSVQPWDAVWEFNV